MPSSARIEVEKAGVSFWMQWICAVPPLILVFSKDGKRFAVFADDKLAACLELERQVLRQAENKLPREWEIIADKLSKCDWTWGCVAAVDLHGRGMFVVDAHRDGKRFVVRADEILPAFLELQRAIHAFAVSLIS